MAFFGSSKCNHPASKLGNLTPKSKGGTWWFVADCKCGAREIKVKKMSNSDKRRHGIP